MLPPVKFSHVANAVTDIKNIAVSRLLLDNFPHIKAYWQSLTPRVAQVALREELDLLHVHYAIPTRLGVPGKEDYRAIPTPI
jgi:hypothetical protein